MVRDRFAPSPTGDVHVGSLRTALYNYLYAKKNNGEFLLRLEDTDRTRYVEGSEKTLLKALFETGLIPDEGLVLEEGEITENGPNGPYRQSERLEIYQPVIDKLIEQGDAYYCFCSKERLDQLRETQRQNGETPKYDGHCRDLSKEEVEERLKRGEPYVIRLKLPKDQTISFEDKLRGTISINTNDLDDQVLIKTDGFPTYHFAVVVDDHDMGVTDVIRGEEWLVSTPKHVYLYDKLGWDRPNYVHLPNILNQNHKKLSKREGDVSVESFLEKGYLPEALINYLALLGWSPETDQEIFSLEELIENFTLDRINHSGAIFDIEKLNWINSQYIKNLEPEALLESLKAYVPEITAPEAELLRDRLNYFAEAPEILREIIEFKEPEPEALELLADERVPVLREALIQKFEEADDLTAENINQLFKQIQKEKKIKGKMFYMPTRIMLTGQMHGPDLSEIILILKKDEVLNRLKQADRLLEGLI